MHRRLFLASLLLIGTGSLAGCGQKGPLFLPKPGVTAPKPATSVQRPATASTVTPPAAARSG